MSEPPRNRGDNSDSARTRRHRRRVASYATSVIFLLIGGLMVLLWVTGGTLALGLRGVETTAVVVDEPELVTDKDGDYYRNIRVSFEYPVGTEHHAEISRSPVSVVGTIRVGSEVGLTIDPEDLSNIDPRPLSDHRAGLVIWPVIVGGLVAGAVLFPVMVRRRDHYRGG